MALRPTEPLPLHHSWPIFERGRRFDLGYLFGSAALDGCTLASIDLERLAAHGIGRWECDLRNDGLNWTDVVFDIFGLPRGARISREDVAALYCEESRAAMERLRAHTVRHRRGFTLDAEIRTTSGNRRWMRLLAAPILSEDRVVRLHGLKQDVSHEYR